MCATCGCDGDGDATTITAPGPGHEHTPDHVHGHVHDHVHTHDDDHTHDHDHDHDHEGHVHTETVTLEQKVLAKNDELAEQNRRWFAERGILALNLTSSPGAGKTTLLERTIRDLSHDRPVAVIEGDQETLLDAERIRAAGARAIQVNTGAGCHLDATMVRRALDALNPESDSTLFIENVGNLVCPALFDLGERSKVVVISVTEGDDKPLKYPHMFAAAGLVIVNKIDLLPYVSFDLDKCRDDLRSLNPDADVLPMSALSGEGSSRWYEWVANRANA
ncbi:hydrogenase nickel incorporation protein HypB [Mycobacterium sp. IDR2000157661]|uniref:hydrogenase nickel incorporation protein HypB n=1 Tax=Mycobacterium sp. IDR2000157661 TaxID=2867005 RepID=UPI001EEB5413|nr:hydrogenase nickel incorporation protein HypB [Mycobacterium sp. IDR2000157661]ULE32952.1 hydrogenase nickel incorporation protein HypB [Mycobacterium sp. IDR2000157661]